MERLDKFLVDSGAGTRSQVKAILKSGRVTVDGVAEKDNSRKVDPQKQEICLDGVRLRGFRYVVLMLNKPAGYVTAVTDPVERTVMELISQEYRSLDVRPVGRLDKQTEGLLLFTNHGELLHRLISPQREIPKKYYARHEGQATQEDVDAFQAGLLLRDGTRCLPAALEPIGPGESYVTLCEGKYHQVRRMMASREMTVTYLERITEGELSLQQLERGNSRELTEEEVCALCEQCGLIWAF